MTLVEREFKWAVNSEPDFERFLSALKSVLGVLPAQKTVQISDSYLDNSGGTLAAEKVALRIRQVDGSFEATLKTRTRLEGGLARRKELTLPLPSAHSTDQALALLKEKQKWEGVKLTDLRVKFEIKNNRTLYEFCYGSAECEAALDRYTIYAAEKELPCREIELELKGGEEKDFMQIVSFLTQQSGLSPAQKSKVATAESMLKK
ncbi:MAG: CYTH domain-containing protein [Elusimicrobiaceae bacterium]|nr:CYTH domain-containing protein [Elusimicrobiaceae bacterium]